MPAGQNQEARTVNKFYSWITARRFLILGLLLGMAGLSLNLLPARAALDPSPVVVDDKVSVSYTGLRLNRTTNTFNTAATLTNFSRAAIQIPIQLAIRNINPATVTLANASGVLPNGTPFVNVPLSDGSLDAGESAGGVVLKFNNPGRVAFKFEHTVPGILPQANQPPLANAGGDQSAVAGDLITLDGSASSDQDGDPLTYRWRIAVKPETSNAGLDDSGAVAPKIAIDRKGDYRIELIVNDGQADSQPDSVVISTGNSKPVARAGDDQTVKVKQTANLDGITSSDIDNDPLTFDWQLIAKPTGSNASLNDAGTQTPNLTPDLPGGYTVQLTVNDGQLDSDADFVVINTENSKPVADAGSDMETTVGVLVTLDGGNSTDVDGDPLSYDWSLINQPDGSGAGLQPGPLPAQVILTPDLPGSYIGQLIVNDGQANSDPDTALVNVVVNPPANNPPRITSTAVLTATVGNLYSYDADAEDGDNDSLTYSLSTFPTGMTINPQTGLIGWTPEAGQTGSQSVTVNVSDNKGGHDSQSFSIEVNAADQTTVPALLGKTRAEAETAIEQANLTIGTLTFEHNAEADGSVIGQSPAAGAAVKIGTAVNLTVSLGPDQGLPPDPATVAPKIDATVATTTFAASEFLYQGNNPIQTGVAPGTIEAKRAAVIRGQVMDKNNAPLPGVSITILNHPEFGQTLSREDGQFDMAMNGGGYLTINYRKDGLLSAQRQVNVPWQDYVMAPDVILIPLDSRVTEVDLTNTATLQVARGNPMTDVDGTRQATILFPAGTQATMTLANGSTTSLTDFHVRATEFTVGPNGPTMMPAALPPSSGYTYEVEYSVDEAEAAGAVRVSFSHPLISYTENFVGFPVGTLVPYGEYDRKKGMWIASENGRVIKILNITQGLATLDLDGSGQAASASALAALGIGAEEQQSLAVLYPSGQSLWRVPIDHFLAIN